MISRDVKFDETTFPLRSIAIHQIPTDGIDDVDDDSPVGAAYEPNQDDISQSTTPPDCPLPIPSQPVPPIPTKRSTRTAQPPSRYGNIRTYAAVTKHDADNPTYSQAMASPEKEHWRAAMQVKFDSLVSHSVGRLIPRPKSANVLGGMWRFKCKRDTSGNVIKYKARWVILGNHQIHGIDYFETYASVGVKESLHTLYALAAPEDLEVQSFDIITAFLTGSMDVPVHTVQVQGFEDQSRDILLLDQSIYGAKQAHCQFNATLKARLASIGFHSTEVDDSLYSQWDDSSFVHMHMHVDDGLVVSNDIQLLNRARQDLSQLYDVKWNENPSEHLGIKLTRDRKLGTIHLSQESYLQRVLDRFGMEGSNPVATPLHSSTRLSSASADDITAHSHFPYREVLGCLNHAAVHTRPDIAHAVSQLAQFSSAYGCKAFAPLRKRVSRCGSHLQTALLPPISPALWVRGRRLRQ